MHTARGALPCAFSFLGTMCRASLEIVLVNSKTSCEGFWQMDLKRQTGRWCGPIFKCAHGSQPRPPTTYIDSSPHWCYQYKVKSLLPSYRDVFEYKWELFFASPDKLTLWKCQTLCWRNKFFKCKLYGTSHQDKLTYTCMRKDTQPTSAVQYKTDQIADPIKRFFF